MPTSRAEQPRTKSERRSIRWDTIAAVVCVVVTSRATAASAETPQNFELHWDAPPGCPQQLDVTEQIRAMLGAASGARLPSGLRAKGMIELFDDRFRLTLTLRLGEIARSRIIASNDCTSLGKAAAVVLGVLLRKEHESGRELSDSDLGSEFQSQPVAREPGARATPSVHPIETPTPHVADATAKMPDASNQRQWHLLLMLPTATVDYFTLPHVGFGLGAGAGFALGNWRWLAAGTVWHNQRMTHGGVEPYEATFERKSFESWICRGWRAHQFELSPCAVAAIDLVAASASGDRLTSKPRTIALMSGGAGLVGFLHLAPNAGLFLSVTGRVAAHRPEFVVSTLVAVDQAHNVPWGTMLTSIGTEWIF